MFALRDDPFTATCSHIDRSRFLVTLRVAVFPIHDLLCFRSSGVADVTAAYRCRMKLDEVVNSASFVTTSDPSERLLENTQITAANLA
jgi:hypothetical protein